MKISMDVFNYITVDTLRDNLYRREDVLILDCRTNEEYKLGHISGSHNIVLPQLMMRRLKANKLSLKNLVPQGYMQGKEAFLQKCTSCQIVLYDHFSTEINSNDTSMLGLLHKRLKDEGCTVLILKGGFAKFQSSFSDFCVKFESPLSSDADEEDCGNDDTPSGGRFSPVSPLTGLAPSILGLGALRISCDTKENGDVDNFNTPQQHFDSNQCDNHRHHQSSRHDRFNSEGESDENSRSAFRPPKCLARISIKPAPINLSSCSCCPDVETPDSVYPSPCGYVNASGPAEILPGLFLGCAKDASSAETLQRFNITYILNVTPNLPNVFEAEGTYKYKQIPITDHWSQNLSQFFPDAISFIEEAKSNKCGVLVHCLAGISRSVTVTVAYLMQTLRWSLNDAYDFVKQRKSNVSPNFNFMGQLLDFEKTLGVGDFSSTEDSSVDSANSGGSSPPTLFFTSPPPPTPTLTLPVQKSGDKKYEQRSAFILPTSVA